MHKGWRVLTEFEAPDVGATTERDFVWGNYLDEALIMVVDGSTDYYFAHDHLFSPVALLNDSGTIVERYEYDAYGKLTRIDPDFTEWSGTPVGNPIFFTGQRLDVLDDGELELMYYKNRYYSPEIGRFISKDPMEYIDGMNYYLYALNSPMVFWDNLGLGVGHHYVPRKVFENFPNLSDDAIAVFENAYSGQTCPTHRPHPAYTDAVWEELEKFRGNKRKPMSGNEVLNG